MCNARASGAYVTLPCGAPGGCPFAPGGYFGSEAVARATLRAELVMFVPEGDGAVLCWRHRAEQLEARLRALGSLGDGAGEAVEVPVGHG